MHCTMALFGNLLYRSTRSRNPCYSLKSASCVVHNQAPRAQCHAFVAQYNNYYAVHDHLILILLLATHVDGSCIGQAIIHTSYATCLTGDITKRSDIQ